ncbi:MAG: hypothetical protein KDE19_19115 [Caldilineaceae bacterium]|nr:hypothetical protein [Caldilineaceae bacterium]
MKSFLVKLAILIPLLFLLQVVAGSLYPMEIPAEVLQFQQQLESEVDVLYFGDSTVWHPRGSQTTPQMVQEYLPARTVGEISHAAYHLDLYLAYIQALVRYTAAHDYRPEWVIIPINMHSFSPEWDQRPEYQFTEEKRILNQGITWSRLFGRPLKIFGDYDSPITREEYRSTTVYSDTVAVGTVADFEDALGNSQLEEKEDAQFVYYQTLPEEGMVENMLVYYYMTPLTVEHQKLQSMLQIVSLLQDAEIGLLFYITPVDTELGDVYLGESFRRRFSANKTVVLDLLAEQNVPVLDLSYDLEAFYFSDTEHLQQEGKRYIAEQLVAQIDPNLPLEQNNMVTTSDNTSDPDNPATAGVTATVTATPSPIPTVDAATNPLLATAAARATQAAGGNGERTPTPPAP